MLIKERDNHDADVEHLRRLLECQITAKQRFFIEREIKCIGSGARGEESSAYYIDFRYKDSVNWAIIHDLRLEHRGFVAQIDHLLINRFLDIYVLESKNYYYGIKITPEGEFLVWNGKMFVAIESPVEQNRRHIELLENMVQGTGILPTRLGIPISPSFLNYVMVAPNSRVDRPAKAKYDTEMVVKADALVSAIDKRVDSTSPTGMVSSLAKLVSQETLETFARKLVRFHRPSKIDFAAKFAVSAVEALAPTSPPAVAVQTTSGAGPGSKKEVACEACGAAVDGKVVYYCGINREKFGGKVLCRSCQQTPETAATVHPRSVEPMGEPITNYSGGGKKGACDKCGVSVDGKVVFFCRMNREKFNGKILCRSCQKAS